MLPAIDHAIRVRRRLYYSSRGIVDSGIDLSRERSSRGVKGWHVKRRKLKSIDPVRLPPIANPTTPLSVVDAVVLCMLQRRPPPFLVAPLFEALHRETEWGEFPSFFDRNGDDCREKIATRNKSKISRIKRLVCRAYNLMHGDIIGRRRQKAIVGPRMIAVYLAVELTNATTPEIGRQFGGRDHTTILHAHKTIAMRREADPELNRTIAGMIAEIEEGGKK